MRKRWATAGKKIRSRLAVGAAVLVIALLGVSLYASGASIRSAVSGWVKSGGLIRAAVSRDDVVLGSATPVNAAKLSIDGDTDQVQFAVQGNATQTTNIFEIEDSTGVELMHFTNKGQLGLMHVAVENDDHAFQITTDAAGFADVKGISVIYDAGTLAATEHVDVSILNIDQSATTGGDVIGYSVLATDSGSAVVRALNVGVGIDPIRQNSGAFGAVGFCEVETSGPTFVDCTTAFNSAGTDVQIWVADNDIVNIGNATTFEEIAWLWDTVIANPGIQPTFEYSTGAGPTWATFTPIDGTNGARNNGVMEWDSSNLAGWSSESLDGDAAFWIRITRTCNPCTGPTEDLVEVAAPVTFSWDKNGDVIVNSIIAPTLTGTVSLAGTQVIDSSASSTPWTLPNVVDALNFDSNTLSIDALNDRVGIGVSDPLQLLHVETSDPGIVSSIYISHLGDTVGDDAQITFAVRNESKFYSIGVDQSDDSFHIAEASNLDSTGIVLSASGHVGIGSIPVTQLPTGGGAPSLIMTVASGNPTGGTINGAGIFSKDVSASAELFALDEAGNIAQLSPHDPETGKWIFYSENIYTGRRLKVNMEDFVRLVIDRLGLEEEGLFEEGFINHD